MPIARPDLARTLLGVPVVVTVLSNDEGAGLAVVGYTSPTAGTLALNPDRSFTFTPTLGFEGTDSFTYTVRDAAGGTAEGEVRIVVARPNAPPVARADVAQLTAGEDVSVAVLANDNDPDGDALALLGIDAPGHGTIQVEAGQAIRYTPQPGFSGIDSFTYTVGDGRGGVSMATVTVSVMSANTPPVTVPDAASTVAGAPVTVDVLANDNDPDGDQVELAGLSLPGHGTLSLTPERHVVYTPAPGFVGTDSFTYTVADSRGAKADGAVHVDVERRNAPPVATPDSVASGGEPVTLDLLANDNDPDGDPLRLTALTLPVKGQIAVNPSGTVTYTPQPGFSGIDSFSYRVSDGAAEAEAEVTVAVTAPEVPTYANGYRYRRRLVVPPQAALAETATDFVLLVREQGDWLKPASSGGRVQSELGHDLRFELEDGTKLDHELERYQPATGSLLAWVRVPSFQLASQVRLFLYHGRPGLAASEANPAGVWRGYLAVYDARTGADRSGRGRELTPSNVAAGELIGEAGAYDGAAVASRADASFLDGHAALTVQALTTPDASMLGSDHGLLAQGPMDGTDAGAGLALQYLRQSGGGAPNVIHFKLACSDGNAFVLSSANAQRAERQLLHGVWRQGQAPALFLDGARVEPSGESAARSGVTAMPSGGLHVGAGARDPATGGWRGLIDEVRIAATAFSPARIAAEAANLAAPQTLYGLGDEDQAAQPDQAPVAVPIRAATTAGANVDIDVAGAAYDPDGPGRPQITALGAPAHGVATVVGGMLRYTPVAGYVGADRVPYTLRSGAKQSSSTVSVTVSAAAEPTRPKYPPPAARTLRVPEDYATVQDAYAAAAAGDHISLASGTYGGSITFGRAIAAGNPVVVKSRSGLDASFGGRVVVTGSGIWFHEVRFAHDAASQGNEDNSATKVSGANVRFTRCHWSGKHALWLDRSVHNIHVGWCSFTGKARDVRTVSHIKLDMPTAGNWQNINQGPHHVYIYRNLFFDNDDRTTDAGDRTQYIYFGDTKVGTGDFGRIPECYVEHNLIYSDGTGRGRARGFYLKRGCVLRHNHQMEYPGDADSTGFRHSDGGEIYGNTIAANLNVNGGHGGTNPDGTPRAAVVYGNAIGGELRLWAGSHNGTVQNPNGLHQAADRVRCAGNRKLGGGALTVVVGHHADILDRSADAGGTIDNVTIHDGGFGHAIQRLAGWHDPATCDAAARVGWGGFQPVVPITLAPTDVGLEVDV